MTFLATRDGQLVDGAVAPWPTPWGFRCNGCGRDLPYACILGRTERRTNRDRAREIDPDTHVCGDCEGYVEQQGLWA